MKKHVMYYEKTAGEPLNEKRIPILDDVLILLCFLVTGLFIREKSLILASVIFFGGMLIIVRNLFLYSGKCPGCKSSIAVKTYRNNCVLYCEKCKSFLYKRDKGIYKLESEENRKIRQIPYGIMVRGISFFLLIEIIAWAILLALGFDKTVIYKIDFINILPIGILLFAFFYNLIQKKKIEVKDSTEEPAN